jgi:YggT family protein
VDLVRWVAQVITLGLIVWIVLSYVVVFGRVAYDHPIRKLYEFFNRLVEPVLRPIRAVVPPVRVGGASLDLSPMILLLIVWIAPTIIDIFI